MKSKIIQYASMNKHFKWNKEKEKTLSNLYKQFRYEPTYTDAILITKEYNHSRLCDFKQLIKHRALRRSFPV